MEALLLALTAATGIALVGYGTATLVRRGRVRLAAADQLDATAKPANLIRPSALAHERRPAPVPGRPSEIARVAGLTMREAEDLLDWLEQNGYSERGVVCEAEKFTVEFRVDAGHVQPGPHQVGQTTPKTSAS